MLKPLLRCELCWKGYLWPCQGYLFLVAYLPVHVARLLPYPDLRKKSIWDSCPSRLRFNFCYRLAWLRPLWWLDSASWLLASSGRKWICRISGRWNKDVSLWWKHQVQKSLIVVPAGRGRLLPRLLPYCCFMKISITVKGAAAGERPGHNDCWLFSESQFWTGNY